VVPPDASVFPRVEHLGVSRGEIVSLNNFEQWVLQSPSRSRIGESASGFQQSETLGRRTLHLRLLPFMIEASTGDANTAGVWYALLLRREQRFL